MKEGVSVRSHWHRLQAENQQDVYICDGCKERGTEWRYTCRACNYDMHKFCATAPPSVPHPLSDAKMILYSSPAANNTLWCSACERSVSGMMYYCSESGDVLHPFCAFLPKIPTVNYNMRLSQNLSTDPCNGCGQRTRGWAYVSREYSIHVRCFKQALDTPETPEFCLSSPQLCNGRLQLTAAPSTSYHQHSTSGTLQKYQPNGSTNWFKSICKKTKLFFKVIWAMLSGDPSSVMQVYVTSFSSYQ